MITKYNKIWRKLEQEIYFILSMLVTKYMCIKNVNIKLVFELKKMEEVRTIKMSKIVIY